MQRNSVFFPFLRDLHYFGTQLGGWWLFNKIVYPLLYMKPETAEKLALSLPVYALNVLAFGALVYLATKPLLYLSDEAIVAFQELVESLLFRRG